MVLFLFSYLLAYTNPTILLDVTPLVLILFLYFFKCFTFFKFIVPSQRSDMNNSFKIIFMKISIIKVNIIKIYTKNTHFITWKCDITRIFIKKSTSSMQIKYYKAFLIILLVANQSGINFNVGKKISTALSHILLSLTSIRPIF